jgi:hypothetical protein
MEFVIGTTTFLGYREMNVCCTVVGGVSFIVTTHLVVIVYITLEPPKWTVFFMEFQSCTGAVTLPELKSNIF